MSVINVCRLAFVLSLSCKQADGIINDVVIYRSNLGMKLCRCKHILRFSRLLVSSPLVRFIVSTVVNLNWFVCVLVHVCFV